MGIKLSLLKIIIYGDKNNIYLRMDLIGIYNIIKPFNSDTYCMMSIMKTRILHCCKLNSQFCNNHLK